MKDLKNILVGVLIIYGMFITYLYNLEYKQRDQYMKNKIKYITHKTNELEARENNIEEKEKVLIDQEKCMVEVTRLRKIIKNAQGSLNIMHTSLLSDKIEEQVQKINKDKEKNLVVKNLKSNIQEEIENINDDLSKIENESEEL